MGVSYSPNNKSSKLNQRGLTPNLTPTVKDNADSTTKSAVAEELFISRIKKSRNRTLQVSIEIPRIA